LLRFCSARAYRARCPRRLDRGALHQRFTSRSATVLPTFGARSGVQKRERSAGMNRALSNSEKQSHRSGRRLPERQAHHCEASGHRKQDAIFGGDEKCIWILHSIPFSGMKLPKRTLPQMQQQELRTNYTGGPKRRQRKSSREYGKCHYARKARN